MKNTLFFLIFIIIASAAIAAADTCKLVSVIDGDTIKVEYENKIQSLRLIGVNAPEGKNTEAAKRVRQILKDRPVVIVEFDIAKYDKYGRLLGYVWLDNTTMLNEKLVAEGYVKPKTYKPNVKYRQRLLDARPGKKTKKSKS
jgi:micrococcal nuclease